MSKLKKRWMRQSILAMSTVMVTGSILCGCSRQEMTRTISLPDIEDEGKGISGIVIKNIQEYTYGGHSEDNLQILEKRAQILPSSSGTRKKAMSIGRLILIRRKR